ncbi:acetyl-CoA hydrolase [Comamonas odontotermitis]|uniref:Acetyl-CoA hydrolase n=1 Tax=Comamonas odontotermitis TaxID=379895 RepID=A0ABR6RBM7_9BURK|nr:acetyl-CoA hydrolase/transferase family protein [Comamonas odontotermitis]MBB6576562.1 acetyl-CoA hydrolase [Comamonas odontotermitis]
MPAPGRQIALADLDLAQFIRAGDSIVWGQSAAEPLSLMQAYVAQRHRFARTCVFLGIGGSATLQPEHADAIDMTGYAAGGSHRTLGMAGVLDPVPCHYSQIPLLIASRSIAVDVVFVQVSPPNDAGECSLGLAHDYMAAAMRSARCVIAEVNVDVPWVHGATLRLDKVDAWVQSDQPVVDVPAGKSGDAETAIARHIASRIEDGATLQLGIGNLPDAVLQALHGHRNLGLHSGTIGDRVADLAEAGVITNTHKGIDAGVSVTGLLMGTARTRRWAHRNPALRIASTDYTHSARVLGQINKLVAINAAIEVDLTGQINAEVVAGQYLGAVGGAMDFLRAAAISPGGLPIVALPATARGQSRIVARLSGPVSTPRADAGLIVTEHGVADLRGLSLSGRMQAMLAIAAPEHRDTLSASARQYFA